MLNLFPRCLRMKWRGAVLLAVAAFFLSCTALPAQAANFVPISGDGSSWAGPAIDQWGKDVKASQNIVVNFSPDGSAAGRLNFSTNQADFAGTDIAYLTEGDPFGGGIESVSLAYSYVPIVAGGTAFMYNLKVGGRQVTDLKLSGDTITKIFTGKINNWSDPQITHDYGSAFPSQPITAVTRADGSGATYQLTRWMSKQYSSQWNAFCAAHDGPNPCPPTEFYPGFAGSQQKNNSDQVAGYVAASYGEGSIGYDEYAYALNSNIPVVKLLNPAGYYTLPTPSNVAIALQAAVIDTRDPKLPTYLTQTLDAVYTNPDPRSYPLSSYSYLIVPRKSRNINNNEVGPPGNFTDAKGVTLSTWLNYVLCGAQQEAGALGYSPLPLELFRPAFDQVDNIPGAVATPNRANFNACNNPTYHDGVNYLLKDAPQPSPCDAINAAANCAGGSVPQTGSTTGPGGTTTGPGGSTVGPGGGTTGPGGATTGPGGAHAVRTTGPKSGTTRSTSSTHPGSSSTSRTVPGQATGGTSSGTHSGTATGGPAQNQGGSNTGPNGAGGPNPLGGASSDPAAKPSVDPETGQTLAAAGGAVSDGGGVSGGGGGSDGGGTNGNAGANGNAGSGSGPIRAQTVAVQGSAGGRSLFGTLTAVELLLAVAIPPLLGSWLRRQRRSR